MYSLTIDNITMLFDHRNFDLACRLWPADLKTEVISSCRLCINLFKLHKRSQKSYSCPTVIIALCSVLCNTLANQVIPFKLQDSTTYKLDGVLTLEVHWPTFSEILYRLHKEGFYIHANQLAEFMVLHGLPVDLQYVPSKLQERARALNANYQGDMAHLSEKSDDYFWYISSL